jgi:1-acyl-sn-glycerol-3-phosphate acyltransferase
MVRAPTMTDDAKSSRSLARFRATTRTGGRAGSALAAFKTAELTLRMLSDYHQHRVLGFERFPKTGPVLAIFNHSFATYDAFLPVVAVFDMFDRVMRGVADRLIFRTPGLADFSRKVGFTEGTREELTFFLDQGEIVGLAPGGMREALRVNRKKYEVDWKRRIGFVRVSVATGAPIVLAACPAADDIFTLYDNPLTAWAYRKFKLPIPAFRGFGPTPVPRPVQLTHLLSEPIPPPHGGARVTEDEIVAHHAYLERRMGALMQEALQLSS